MVSFNMWKQFDDRTNVLVVEQFPHCANVIASGLDVRREQMPKRVARDPIDHSGFQAKRATAFCTGDLHE